MRYALLILFFAVLAIPQFPSNPQNSSGTPRSSAPAGAESRPKRAPILGFVESKSTTPIMDTDVFDEQKYLEEAGSDSSNAKVKRADHEAALTREFMDGFNQTKECDGVVLLGKGDNKPDFALQIIVDSHDTPGQKPVWNWILREIRTDRLLPVGNEDSGKQAAQGICLAVLKAATK